MSLEHVFPEAVGGTLVIRDVCKTCNDRLGHEVDPGLVNNSLISLRRMQLGLTGKKGKLPNPFSGARLTADPRLEIRFDPTVEGAERLFMPQRVFKKEIEDGSTKVQLFVDASEEDRIPELLAKLEERSNKRGRARGVAYKLSEARQTRTSAQNPELTIEWQFDLNAMARALLKIGYELAYHRLGPAYLADPTAETIRSLLALKKQDVSPEVLGETRLRGSLGFGPAEILMGVGLDAQDALYGLLLPVDGQVFCVVQVLGAIHATMLIAETAHGLEEHEAHLFLTSVPDGNNADVPLFDHLLGE